MTPDPWLDAAHLLLGHQVMRIDCLESRAWRAGGRGLYVAPELPAELAEDIALHVALQISLAARRKQ